MKKILAILTALLLVSCSLNHDEVVVDVSSEVNHLNSEEQIRKTVTELLNKIDPQTRGTVRTIENIETITYGQMFGGSSRAQIPTTGNNFGVPLLHIAIFENNNGFALLTPLFDEDDYLVEDWEDEEADDGGSSSTTTTPIRLLALVDRGTISAADITRYTNDYDIGNNDMSISDVYDGEDDDFLIGGSEANTHVAGLISSYLYNKVTFPENEAVYNDVEDVANDNTVGPLLSTKWWQTNPFNYYFDTMYNSTNKRFAGCTTIAIAQIMTYLQNRSLSYYFNVPSSITWTQIEAEQFSPSTTFENMNDVEKATAKMIRTIADDMGVIYFGDDGTLATAAMAKRYLENYPGYSIDKDTGGRNAARLRKIVNSINNNKPVFMSAISKVVDGHSWVVDGYMKNENSESAVQDYLIHCNFGWGGDNDGWYFLNVLDSDKNNNDLLDTGSEVAESFKYTWLFRYLFFR